MNLTYIFHYNPDQSIIGRVEINGALYPYTFIEKEEPINEPQQLNLWGVPLFLDQ